MKADVEFLKQRCAQYLAEEPDEALRKEIQQLLCQNGQAHKELLSRMQHHLRFGTAGLRARMEAGYDRMNIASVYRLAWALCDGVRKNAVIGFDGRTNSEFFAQEVAQVLSAMNIKVYLFSELIPTPLCAFATKYLGAEIGVMITASHNPGYDNGIKLFDKSGAQANGKILEDIERAMNEAPLRNDFYQENISQLAPIQIGSKIFDAYFTAIKQTNLLAPKDLDHSVSIIYTALHGVGQKFFKRAVSDSGFNNIRYVSEQAAPDGAFPTLPFPNPEEEHTLDRAHEQAKLHDCEWVFANDPDADRLQVSCPDSLGHFKKLSGNEMGSILGFFAIERALTLNERPLVASSIVSSRMLKTIARDMGASYVDALTGFSNIAHAAIKFQAKLKSRFVFGYEEAIGFLVGQVVLDKDGINAAARFLEIAAWLKKKNMSVWDFLDQLYLRFGLFKNTQWSLRFDGLDARSDMNKIMSNVRALKPEKLAIALKLDSCDKFDLLNPNLVGTYAGIRADVVIFESDMNYRLIIRPSGTEPKIKFYLEIEERVKNLPELSTRKAQLAENLCVYQRIIEDLFTRQQ